MKYIHSINTLAAKPSPQVRATPVQRRASAQECSVNRQLKGVRFWLEAGCALDQAKDQKDGSKLGP